MQTFSHYLNTYEEYGEVIRINHPVVAVRGLPGLRIKEIVLFEDGQIGEVFTLYKDEASVLVFSSEPVSVGSRLVRTNEALQIPAGEALLGQTISPLGRSLSFSTPIPSLPDLFPVHTVPEGILGRKRITRPLLTGVTVVDMLLPFGKGQKELILGDRKTGKSSFVLNAMQEQAAEGAIIVYGAIGKKKSDIALVESIISKNKMAKNMVIVASYALDSPGLIYLTPFSAMTIAEYFASKGSDVVLVLDDLLTHAKYYREFSLIAKKYPGRDSYPGNIFYTYARLLERAGNFTHKEKGEVAITCLPVVETLEGDVSDYLTTNLMSITDGHLFFDTDIFYEGRRPSINIELSITRVGKQTQNKLSSQLASRISAHLADYNRVKSLSYFGQELSEDAKITLQRGEQILTLFDQSEHLLIPLEIQLVMIGLLLNGMLQGDKEHVRSTEKILIEKAQEKTYQELFASFMSLQTIDEFLSVIKKEGNKLQNLWQK
ncbi:MAG TPA: hypothetical protein VGT05_04350 [Patescibacteria group bacterium]|nr:hypothetical protein [Patescibacteria group bacterium]